MIIKRKCFSFGLTLIDKKPITLDEVEKLNKIYPGFIDNSHEDLTKNLKLGKKLDNYLAMRIFKNNKYKLLGVRPISDNINSNPTTKSYYLYFDSSTQIDLDKLKKFGLLTYDDLIEGREEGSTLKNPNVTLFGKKIIFDKIGKFNSFNFNEFKRKVKLDDFYKAIYEYINEFGDKLSLNDVKRRMKLGEVTWNGMDNILTVIFEDSTTGLCYSFNFESPNDKVEVKYVFD